MKAFFVALTVMALSVTGVILASHKAISHIDAYLTALPSPTSPTEDTAEALEDILIRLEEDLWIGCMLPHDKVDELLATMARARAAARDGDSAEYRIGCAEVARMLHNMRGDLMPRFLDIL